MSRTFPQLVRPWGLETGLASWVDCWRTAGKRPAGFLPVPNLMYPRQGPSLQCRYSPGAPGAPCAWAALRMPGEGLGQRQKPQQTLTLANGGSLEMDLFSFWLN